MGVGESAPGRVRAVLTAATRQRDLARAIFESRQRASHPAPRFVSRPIERERKPRSRAGSRARAGRKGWGPRGSTLTFSLSSLLARAPPRAQVHNAAATVEPGSIPGSRLASWVAARAARERARGRVEQRPKAQPRRCRFASLAVAACGAHAHRSLRCVVPRGSRSGVEFARFSFSVGESREPPQYVRTQYPAVSRDKFARS